jgi:hypothetical protein
MVTVPIMRADERDAIGQLAYAGDDCVEPGALSAGAAGPRSCQATQLASLHARFQAEFCQEVDTSALTVATGTHKAG